MTIIRTKAQEAVLRIFQETVRNVRADSLIRSTCWREGNSLYLLGNPVDLTQYRRIIVLGAGKASAAMAHAIVELTEGFEVGGVVVTKYGHAIDAGSIEILEAGHPVPDENSVVAGNRILETARTATSEDLVFVLISGGASALMESPLEEVSLDDIRSITDSLLKAGADIHEMNAVRSCLSNVKAGGLARACGEAKIVCLLLSDVIGNAREIIGSGPCWGAPPDGSSALHVLLKHQILVPDAVLPVLRRTTHVHPVYPEHLVIGDIFTLLETAQKIAEGLGMKPMVYGRTFSGEAREVGARMAAEALSLRDDAGKYDCIIAAGETVVSVKGNGIGGRNQELACAAALALQDVPDVALLAAGTDGTDGPTDAAGGLIDGSTYKLTNLMAALNNNDSYHALEEAAALLETGPTQTNLTDLVVIARVVEE